MPEKDLLSGLGIYSEDGAVGFPDLELAFRLVSDEVPITRGSSGQ